MRPAAVPLDLAWERTRGCSVAFLNWLGPQAIGLAFVVVNVCADLFSGPPGTVAVESGY